jgi:hypothetical protein
MIKKIPGFYASRNFSIIFVKARQYIVPLPVLLILHHYVLYLRVYLIRYYIYLLTAIGLTPSGSITVHIYTQTIHRTTKKKQYIEHTKNYIEQHKNKLEQCGPCPVLVSYTLAFALQLIKKHGKTSVRVAEQ